jgi:type I restriction enzyme, S subunit
MSQKKIARLEDVAQVLGGGTPSRTEKKYFGGGIAWATPTDITKLGQLHIWKTKETVSEAGLRNSSAKLMQPGAVLLTSRATIGFTAVSAVPICTNQGFINFVCGPEMIPEYLAYWLSTQKAKMIQHAGGTTFKEIARGTLRKFEIPVPPLPEQRRIVDLLSRAEGIVRLRREAEKKAAELIPALFLEMFGDPATNPKGWAVATLGEVVKEFRYGTSQKSGPTGFPVLRIPNVVGDRLELAEMKLVAVSDAEANRLRLLDGDILFVRTNGNQDYVGRSAVFDSEVMRSAGFDGNNSLYASYLIRARLNRVLLEPQFVQAYLSSTEGRKKLKERCRTSAGQFNINTVGLASIPLLVPSFASQTDFVKRCRNVLGLKSQQSAATAKAQAVFDALLAKAFAG